MDSKAELIIHNGPIHTMEGAEQVEAVAIRDGRILATGRWAEIEPLRGRNSRLLDLAGRTLLPGFNDAHIHVWKKGHLLTTMLDLTPRQVGSIDEIRSRVAERARQLPPDGWLLGRGYNELLLAEGRLPTRHDLDGVSGGRPVCLTRTCAHIHTLNSTALALAGIDRHTPDPPGGEIERDEAGEPTGVLKENAFGLVLRVIPSHSAAALEEMILAGARHLLTLGITSATDPAVDPPLLAVYRELAAHRRLPLRLNLLAIRRPDGGSENYPLPDRYQDDHLRVDSVKFFGDGGLSGATARLSEPYRNSASPTRGILRFETEELAELAWEAHAAGLRIGTHAIGDVTIEQVLGIYERLQQRMPRPHLRHRIEHFGLPDRGQLQRAARLGIIAVPQAIFLSEMGVNFRRYLPPSFLPRCYPLRAMLDAGLTVALSSDGPVVQELNPLAGMRDAILRLDRQGEPLAPEQRISAREALYAYTMGGAIAQGDEANRGSIAPGKWADLVLLDRDPLATAAEALPSIRVEMALVGGRLLFER